MNQNIRDTICQWIASEATDEEITQFATDIKTRKQHEQKLVQDLAQFVGFNAINGKVKDEQPKDIPSKPTVKPTPVFAALPDVVVSDATPVKPSQTLVEPPGEASSKIGADTRDKIRSHLSVSSATLAELAAIIKRPSSATKPLLKLLWARKEIIFDGTHYMLRS